MKRIFILLSVLSFVATARAGWFFDDPPQPPDLGPEYRAKIVRLEEQMSEQLQTADRWKIASGSLAVGAVLLFVIGTALGAKTRQSYDATRLVGRTHPAGANGARHPMGDPDPQAGRPTMAA